jgi:chromosome condensin MukBEF complex kleisin-like MukF subunit
VDLANRLSRIPEVAAFDTSCEPQGDTIAHALNGWEDSFAEILDVLLPKLVKDKGASTEDLNDTLHEIGDQLRHILYRIQDTK